MTMPHFVTKLYFLAMYPSNTSVAPASRNIEIAITRLLSIDEKKNSTKTGIRKSLNRVRILGIFIYLPI